MMNMAEAYVTLVATEAYAAGALVLAHRLRELGSVKDIVCLTTPNISSKVTEQLGKVSIVIEVDEKRSKNEDNLRLLGRPELDITFTKIQLWKLTQYQKVVFLDADTLPLLNVDELFDRPALSAAPDAGWPDCFNSGVFVAEPSDAIYDSLIRLSEEKGSFDGGDQGLLNSFFSTWSSSPENRLPFTFNTTPTAQYGYAPALNEFGHSISILHFIGQNKPWSYQRFSDGSILPRGDTWHGVKDMLQLWWDTWDKHYGRVSPYHLLSGSHQESPTFDSGFQTRPILPFDETVENAWENQQYHPQDHRRQVNPMPPLFSITIGQPEWIQQAPSMQEDDFNSAELNDHNKQEEEEKEEYHSVQEQASTEQHDEGYYEDQHHNENQQEACQDASTYFMIEWDPAHQEPPKTGALTAEMPDLSNFKNAWDQPTSQNSVWVAPLHHPDPQVMARPEYAQYDTKEYEIAQSQFHKIYHHSETDQGANKHDEKDHRVGQHQENRMEHQYNSQHHGSETDNQSNEYHHIEQEHHHQTQYEPQPQHHVHYENQNDKTDHHEQVAHTDSPNLEYHQQEHNLNQESHHHHHYHHHQAENHHYEEHHHHHHHPHPHHHHHQTEGHHNHHYEEHSHQAENHQSHHYEDHHHQAESSHQYNTQENIYDKDSQHQNHHSNNEQHNHADPETTHPVIQAIAHPPIFPWETKQHDLPPPTRIWLDEQPAPEPIVPVQDEEKNDAPAEQEAHKQETHEQVSFPPVFPWENVAHHFPPPTRIWQDEEPRMESQVKKPSVSSPALSSPNAEETQEELAMSEPSDLLFSADPMELTDEPSSEFALDYSPSFQNKLVDFIEMLHTDQDDDVSVRDLIPINLKPSSRLNSGMYTPSSGATSRTQSRSNSRRASVASSRRSSVSRKSLPPPSLDITQNAKPSSAKLFAAESSFYSHKTPYTSAAVTPAVQRTPEMEKESYFDDWVEQEPVKRDFLNTMDYSLEHSIEQQKNLAPEWNPSKALEKLKQQSESMVLRKSLEQVLKSNLEQEDGRELETEPVLVQNRVPLFESVWEKTAFDISSGRSSPRTPVLKPSSKLLQLEMDKYKQQHESLMLAQPQATVASTLEAQLDLSQGNLIHDSVYNQPEPEEQDFEPGAPVGQQSEPFATYYDWNVMQQSRKKLSQLLSGTPSYDEPSGTPLYAVEAKPFVFPTNSYQYNFGFEETPKFTAPFDMYENDVQLDPIIEFAKTKLATLTQKSVKDPQASPTNLCEDTAAVSSATAESTSGLPDAPPTNIPDYAGNQAKATFDFVQLLESTPDAQSTASDTELYQQDFLYTDSKLIDQASLDDESASPSFDIGHDFSLQEELNTGRAKLEQVGDSSKAEDKELCDLDESSLPLKKTGVQGLSTEIKKLIFTPTATSAIPVNKHANVDPLDDIQVASSLVDDDKQIGSTSSNAPKNNNKSNSKIQK